jgi:signal transduction histidine kinase
MTQSHTMIRRRWPLLSLLIGTLAGTCPGQKASNWRAYKLADRLPESACISVTISPQGKVLARHFALPFLSELDGYSIRSIPAPEIGRSRVYQSPGGQLWSVAPDGLQEFKDGGWVLHRLPEISGENRGSSSRVIDPIPLWPVRQNLVLLLLPERLVEYNSEDPQRPATRVLREAKRTRLGGFTSLAPARDGGLWIAGTYGLAKVPGPVRNLRPDTEWLDYLPPPSWHVQNLQGLHEDDEGGVSAVAESTTNQQRVVVYFDGHDWSMQPGGAEKFRQAWRSVDRTRWVMSTEALFESDETKPEWAENDEVSARAYFDVGVQAGSTFWLATSDGLFRYAPSLWRTPAGSRRINSAVDCAAGDPAGTLWFIAGGRLNQFQGDQLKTLPLPESVGHGVRVRDLFVLKNSTLALVVEDTESSAGDELYVLRPGETKVEAVSKRGSAQRWRALGMLKDGRLCLQAWPGNGSDAGALKAFDGREAGDLLETGPGNVAGTNWHNLFVAQNGDWWLGTERGVACFSEEKWRVFVSTDKTTPENPSAFAELPDGRIWCATQDEIWEFDGHNWSVVRRGFDHINALIRTRDGSVWVASNSGLFRNLQGAWIENNVEEGLPSSAVRNLHEDPRGRLWAATTRGLSLFHPDADPDPPHTTIQSFPGPESSLPEGGTISLSFSGQDKWKYTPRERLLFSYRLDVRDWTPFQEASRILLNDVAAGKHYFQVRAMDRNGNVDPQPVRREFVVVPPWYKETRLLLISCGGASVALFFAALAFNRHLRLSRSYAEIERKVAERTKQLEVANRELVHSQKMNALGTLAAGIAHDFNNILSIIKGSTQIIEDNLQNPEKIQTRTDRIKLVVEQGTGIVKAMLGFSRDSGQEPALCDLNDVVQDTRKLLGDRFVREVEIDFQPSPGLPGVLASKDFIQQILLNFIFNAAESMTTKKRIVLSTHLVEKLASDLVLPPIPAERYVKVSVQDWGCGITPDNLPRVFEPFFTTKALSTRRGTGLGLSMAYELARKLGAGLSVESAINQGSIFSLILPVRDLDGAQA